MLDAEIHLWFARDSDCTPELLARYRDELMNDEERVRHLRFHFERDRNQFALTRALVRTVLSRYAPIAPADWQFAKASHGRPYICNPQPPALNFNLSHTKGLVVLAISAPMTMGVDVENCVQRAAPLEVAEGYFSKPEVASLFALPASEQQERFFHYWTLKESFIKAEGQGLSLPLDQFSMQFARPDAVEIDFHRPLVAQPENWRFWLLQPFAEYLTALCVQSAAQQAPQLRSRRCLPLVDDAEMSCQLLRQSQWSVT